MVLTEQVGQLMVRKGAGERDVAFEPEPLDALFQVGPRLSVSNERQPPIGASRRYASKRLEQYVDPVVGDQASRPATMQDGSSLES